MTTKSKKDFSKGKVYKIEPVCDHDEGDIFIGSTTKDYLTLSDGSQLGTAFWPSFFQ